MNQILRIKYRSVQGIKEGYFIKTKLGYIQLSVRKGEFIEINNGNIINANEVSVNTFSGEIK